MRKTTFNLETLEEKMNTHPLKTEIEMTRVHARTVFNAARHYSLGYAILHDVRASFSKGYRKELRDALKYVPDVYARYGC